MRRKVTHMVLRRRSSCRFLVLPCLGVQPVNLFDCLLQPLGCCCMFSVCICQLLLCCHLLLLQQCVRLLFVLPKLRLPFSTDCSSHALCLRSDMVS